MASSLGCFSASTHRWSVLTKHLSIKRLTVKSVSEIRWSARPDATAAVCEGYGDIRNALDKIADDALQMASTSHEADCLSEKNGISKNSISQ